MKKVVEINKGLAIIGMESWSLEGHHKMHPAKHHAINSMAEKYKKQLTDKQFDICFNGGTEQAFTGLYWNTFEPGIYISIASGSPLFSSKDKIKTGDGWPSFS